MREEKTKHVPYKYRAPGTREGGRKQWKKNRAKKKEDRKQRERERERTRTKHKKT
jgi:hypothetical protein